MAMTWQEFKATVDAQLEKSAISQDVPIWYIDVVFPRQEDFDCENIMVSINTTHGLTIA